MRSFKAFLTTFLIVALAAAFCGCSGYGRHTMTGHFSEQQLGEGTYIVYYDGGGGTSSDKVWYYWIYRCAELTKEKGFDNFALSPVPVPPKTSMNEESGAGQGWRIIKTKGGGSAPTFIYTPGYSVTTWHSKGVVTMFRTLAPLDAKVGYHAQAILDQLQDYVQSDGKAAVANRVTILENAGFAVTPWTMPGI